MREQDSGTATIMAEGVLPARSRLLALLGVLLAHGLMLSLFLRTTHVPPVPVSTPAIEGVLISTQPDPVATPALPPPEPSPPERAPAVTPRPVPEAPPSERALTTPDAPSPATPAPTGPSPEVSAPAQEVPAPAATDSAATAVTPPRSDAAHLNNPKPVYPALSRRLKEHGRVVVDVYILADGSVGETRLKTSSGYRRLDDAALQAVRRWKYIPARRGNEPVALWYSQSLVFSLVQ